MRKHVFVSILLTTVAIAAAGCDMYDAEIDQGIASTESIASVRSGLLSVEAWGYAWAQNPTGDYVASPTFSRNSSGDLFGQGVDNTVTHLGTGRYRVDFPGLGAAVGGNVQVTAYGSDSNKCKVRNWNVSGGAVRVFVDCYSADGAPTDTQFTTAYVRRSGVGGQGTAYLWADDVEANSYTPSATYQFNSSGGINTIDRTGMGQYSVTLPNQTALGASVQVTAYGGESANDCKVQRWNQVAGGVRVLVRCFDETGEPSNSRFTLNFGRHFPNEGLAYSFVWANQQNAASYTPSLSYQRGFISGDAGEVAADITAGKLAEGQYFVDLPSMSPTGSNVQVTAYGTQDTHCKVVNWFASVGGTRVNVICHNAAGETADSQFVAVYTDDLFILL